MKKLYFLEKTLELVLSDDKQYEIKLALRTTNPKTKLPDLSLVVDLLEHTDNVDDIVEQFCEYLQNELQQNESIMSCRLKVINKITYFATGCILNKEKWG